MFCAKCGNKNEDTSKHCSNCGFSLNQSSNIETVKTELTDEELYKAYIGSSNQDYYLNHFKRFDADGKTSATWHWPAFFVTFYWLLYRKMWLQALAYFVSPYIAMIFIGILAGIAGESAGIIVAILYLAFYVAIFVLPGMYANAFYYLHCKKKIAEVTARNLSAERTLGELTGLGNTSNAGLIIALVFVGIAMIGILAAIAIPAYQDYTTRARLTQALMIEKTAATAVSSYYLEHQGFPADLTQAGFTTPLPPFITSLNIDEADGTLVATMANTPISGKTLLLVPSKDASNGITWTCKADEIKDKLLPPACRQQN
jgi:type II secretory pathway pseudopilin PulG